MVVAKGGIFGGLAALLLLAGARTVRAEEEEERREVPVALVAKADAAELADTGRFTLRLEAKVLEDVGRAYRIQARVHQGVHELAAVDHSPEPPTVRWKKGQTIRWEVPVALPADEGLSAGIHLSVRVGFFDPERDRTLPPHEPEGAIGGRATLVELEVPEAPPPDDPATVDRLLARAGEYAKQGKKAHAWHALVRGIRRAMEDATKYRYRDAIYAMGPVAPEPPSLLERQVVAARIADEERRWLELMAGRHFDQGHLFAALRLLEKVGGTLKEQADSAVIGALAEAERKEKDAQEIRVRILATATDEDKERAAKAIQSLGLGRKLLERAEEWRKEKQWARARILLREASLTSDQELKVEARAKLDALEAEWLADTPPQEARWVEEAVSNPAFGRLATVATQEFLLIGPRGLVEGIPPPSRLRYDLSYVFQTDLFGRVPNPGGDRITVFFKELWDFGGGVGGGKTIDIGKADPEQKGYRLDVGLLYHELTHCIDDMDPIHAGFREGLANFGAAYSFEALGQKGDDLHAFESNLRAFREEYLQRDIPYWLIQNYGPSAGFFLHFVEEHSRTPTGHDWKPYRRFFREYRATPVHDGREPYLARVLAYYLVRAFGPKAFDDLVRFRFPLDETDREAIGKEVEAFARGDSAIRRLEDELGPHPRSPLRRDLVARRMIEARRNPEKARQIGEEELGIVYDWWVIGPFKADGADSRVVAFPPEREIDVTKEYASGLNSCKWRRVEDTGVVHRDALGWIGWEFSYQDWTSTYAVTHVEVPTEQDGFLHVRADDDFVVFLGGRRVGGFVTRGHNASDWLWWRGPAEKMTDSMRFPVRLRAGRNRILVKVRNRVGEAGFTLAVSGTDGRAVPGIRVAADPIPADTPAPLPKVTWKSAYHADFERGGTASKLEVTVGEFKVVNKRLVGLANDGRVEWRKYTVRPGFPKDAPSNLAWLPAKATDGIDDLRFTAELLPQGTPKLTVTIQGDGGRDGLCGWTLIVHPSGDKRVAARLERYDDVAYEMEPQPTPEGEVLPLVLTCRDHKVTVTLGSLVLFEEVPIVPIAGKRRVGFSTFGPSLPFRSLDLDVPR